MKFGWVISSFWVWFLHLWNGDDINCLWAVFWELIMHPINDWHQCHYHSNKSYDVQQVTFWALASWSIKWRDWTRWDLIPCPNFIPYESYDSLLLVSFSVSSQHINRHIIVFGNTYYDLFFPMPFSMPSLTFKEWSRNVYLKKNPNVYLWMNK